MRGSKYRTVPPECVNVGDEIRATFKSDGITHTRQGVVQDVRYVGQRKMFITGEGGVIFAYNKSRKDRSLSVEMLREYHPSPPALFDL